MTYPRVKVRAEITIYGLEAGEEAEIDRDEHVEILLEKGFYVQLVQRNA